MQCLILKPHATQQEKTISTIRDTDISRHNGDPIDGLPIIFRGVSGGPSDGSHDTRASRAPVRLIVVVFPQHEKFLLFCMIKQNKTEFCIGKQMINSSPFAII